MQNIDTSALAAAKAKLDAAVFDAIHVKGLKLIDDKSIQEWVVSQGVDAKKFSGLFKAVCMLAPGTYEYKFVINGEWTVDPNNPNFVVNDLGTLNSVVEVS